MKNRFKLASFKTTRYSWLLANLFVALFSLSQIITIVHKVDHLNQHSDSACTYCINSVNNAIANDTISFVIVLSDFEKPSIPDICFVDLEEPFHFCARAPPVA